MPVLVGLSIDIRGVTFDLADDEITIGRTEDNSITLENASLSGRHCVLARQGASFVLRDLQSTNGTRVNGHPIQEATLRDQDVIHLGTLEFVFSDQPPDDVDLETLQTRVVTPPAATVEVAAEPIDKPASCSSVSPFTASVKPRKPAWFVLIWMIAILALACVGLLFYLLLTTD